ncbi:MAG: DUF1501 domain-containing protein [Planctomycetes bacterium]|nr:DUF1501 domain-containing protein [Planctomycetota bacterium]
MTLDPLAELRHRLTRRELLGRTATRLGTAALAALLSPQLLARDGEGAAPDLGTMSGAPHAAPKAKRVIWLCMSGAPSQLDLFDWKPGLDARFDQDLPDSIRSGQRFTTMTSGQARFPVAPTRYRFAQHGEARIWMSELLPHLARVADRLCVVKSLHTEAINHDPGITFLHTGSELPGRPAMGAWLSYGLGSPNQDLPSYVVLHSSWSGKRDAQALFSRLWGSGFLPSRHQGVALRSQGDPVLYLSDPPGIDGAARRAQLDDVAALNAQHFATVGDPEIEARIAQYEMAFRMQTSVPELTDLRDEPESVRALYGKDVDRPGTFAANCLLARRMAERGVRFIEVFLRDWDHHGDLTRDLPLMCGDMDQAAAGLIEDLAQRGLLDETLVVWAGEFGRTVYCQGPLSREQYGRDHHPRCFTVWMAGGGVRGGMTHGETDDFSYNIVRDPVHVHDLNATVLRCLGIDHTQLTYFHQGRDYRLTDVHGEVVKALLA